MKSGKYLFRCNSKGVVRVKTLDGLIDYTASESLTILKTYSCKSFREFFRKYKVKFDFIEGYAVCRLNLNFEKLTVVQELIY